MSKLLFPVDVYAPQNKKQRRRNQIKMGKINFFWFQPWKYIKASAKAPTQKVEVSEMIQKSIEILEADETRVQLTEVKLLSSANESPS